MKKKSILLLPLILFGMVLAGCHGKKSSDNSGGNSDTPVNPQPSGGDGGEGEGGGTTPATVAVTSVSLRQSLELSVGDNYTLTPSILPDNASDKTVTWATDNDAVATVVDGLVTGVAAGTATITATSNSDSTKVGRCTVTVTSSVVPPDPGPGPQPPEPVQSPYGVKIGTGEVQNVPANAEFVPSGNHAGAYKLEGLTVHAGDALSFYNETVAIAENLGPNNDGEGNYNNYRGSLADGFTVQADATNATLYLDYYEPETAEGHDWLGFFLTGGTSGDHGNGGGSQTQAAGVVHYGQGTEWEDADMESYNESGYEELRVLELNLAENTEFAIHVGDGDDWRHFGDGKNEAAIESHDIVDGEGADHNFKVANAGKYDIYVKVEKGQDEKTVYIARKGDYVPVEHTYGLVGKYGSYNWDHDDEMVVNGAKTEASIENVALSTGDLIKVRLDGKWTHAYGWNDLTVKPEGAFKDGGEPDHNIEVVLDGIYDIKFVIETHKIEITAHAAPVNPVSLECEYKGGEVEVGHALEEDKVFVYVKYSDNSLGTENVASEAHYFADSVEVQTDQIFTAAGSYEITVKYTVDEQELQGTMTVVVVDALVDLNGITPSPTETTLKVGETQQISLTFNPENASDKNVEYVSDHTEIATVSESGLITAVAVGNATISINGAQGVTATVDVTVEAAPEAAYYVLGLNGDWTIANGVAFARNDDGKAENVDKQYKAEFDVDKDEAFKFNNGIIYDNPGWEYYGYNLLEANDAFEDDADNNIVAKYNGHVTAYLKFLNDDSVAIYLGFEETKANYSLTGVPAEWTSASDYYVWAWGGSVNAGAKFNATLDGTTISLAIPESATHFLVVKVEKGKEFIPSSWGNVEDQSRDIVIKNAVSEYPFTAPVVDYSLTVAIASAFAGTEEGKYGAGGALTFVYVWNGTENEWIKVVDGSVVIPGKYEHFIVVRMDPAKEASPSWDGKWNKTGDIDIDSTKTTVTITGWGSEDLLTYTYA